MSHQNRRQSQIPQSQMRRSSSTVNVEPSSLSQPKMIGRALDFKSTLDGSSRISVIGRSSSIDSSNRQSLAAFNNNNNSNNNPNRPSLARQSSFGGGGGAARPSIGTALKSNEVLTITAEICRVS